MAIEVCPMCDGLVVADCLACGGERRVLVFHTVYSSPKDYPGQFAMRRCITLRDGRVVMHKEIALAKTLEEIRESIPPDNVRMERSPDDDPVIVEVWL